MRIPLSSPDITENDIEAVVGVLRTPDLSLGPKLPEFEQAFAEYVGVPHGVALSSGTAVLQLGLQALDIGEGDEVILPSFTFIAVANAILQQRAIPVFADIDPVTLNMQPDSLQSVITPRSRAIMVVHTFGYPANLDSILNIARKHRLHVIEDACEAIGAEYDGQKIGAFGDLGVFSFYPNKPITTGEGGVVVTRDVTLARTMRALRNQGRMDNEGWLQHSLLGYNYRLPEMSCALGISQLKRINDILTRREAVASCYGEILKGYPFITPPPMSPANSRVCWFAFVVRLPGQFTQGDRDQVTRALTAAGIGCRPYFPPIHLQPLYSGYARRSLPVTEDVAVRTLALPFFNKLREDQIREVCRVLGEATQLAAERKKDFPRTSTDGLSPSHNRR
jgi:perosamine synthetase